MRSLRVKRSLSFAVLAATAIIASVIAGSTSATVVPYTKPTAPYQVSGNKVLGQNGIQFVPHGFVIDCAAFAEPVDTLCKGDSGQNPWPVDEMLTAAAKYWRANIVRLQVAPALLMPGQDTIDATYLKLIDSIVSEAKSLGLVTILSDQTEYFHGPGLPVASDLAFWQFMANHFKANGHVMFDLYNEPRLLPQPSTTTQPALTWKGIWNLWQNGGSYGGTTYVGDNAVISAIRATGARNVLIAESNDFDRKLSGLPTHLLTDPRGNTIYGVEPNLSGKDDTKAEWASHFGNFAATYPIFPEAFLPRYEECNSNAPTVLPEELNYLAQIHMGVIVWTLLPGETTRRDDLERPTTFNRKLASSDPCLSNPKKRVTRKTLYGEGADIHSYFTTGVG